MFILFMKGGNTMAFTFKPLWKKLIDKEMTKDMFRKEIGVSTSTLAKMRKDEYISMEVLDKMCIYFDCQPCELLEYVPSIKK